MIAPLRSALRQLLEGVPASRTPTVRRCDHPDALLASNLPLIADEADVARFVRACEADGWTVTPSRGWLLLDHPIPAPDAPGPADFAGETGCLLSLLMRRPDDRAPCEAEIRALAKAADESPAAVNRLCAAMHRDWAVRLRLHQPLPGALAPYLIHVHRHMSVSKEVKP